MRGPLAAAPPQIIAHLAAAILAAGLAVAISLLPKGTGRHRITGRLRVGLMLAAALTARLISEGTTMIGPFGPIHLLVLVTLHGLWQGTQAIRRGDVAAHAQAMRSLVIFALVGAGTFTLVPGRRLSTLILGADAGWMGSLALMVPLLAFGATLAWRWRVLSGAEGARRALSGAFRARDGA